MRVVRVRPRCMVGRPRAGHIHIRKRKRTGRSLGGECNLYLDSFEEYTTTGGAFVEGIVTDNINPHLIEEYAQVRYGRESALEIAQP